MKPRHSNFVRDLVEYYLSETIHLTRPSAYLEMGIQKAITFNEVAVQFDKAVAVDVLPCGGIKLKDAQFFQMDTDDFIKDVLPTLGLQFDIAFIDAGHGDLQVMRDFEGVFPHVKENGLILLHDTYPQNEEYKSLSFCGTAYKTAWKIRQEWREKCEIVTLPIGHGLSLVRKADRQLMWEK